MATTRLCSIPGCDKLHDSHGYCNRHRIAFRAILLSFFGLAGATGIARAVSGAIAYRRMRR